jgi:hypothetical protein
LALEELPNVPCSVEHTGDVDTILHWEIEGEWVLGHTNEVVVFSVETESGGTELWRSDGTAAGTFAVSLLPSVGTADAYHDDEEKRAVVGTAGNTVFFSGCAPGRGCDLWAIAISGQSTAPGDQPAGHIFADVSVLKRASRHGFGQEELLWVDRRSPKHTFIRAQVTGLGNEPAGAATLRLHVAETHDAPSTAAGRIHLMEDCRWDEDTTTWKNQPAFEGEKPLDTPSGSVVRGQTVEFDVTNAIIGDGVYCFALDSESSDGLEYYSREAEARADPSCSSVGRTRPLLASSSPTPQYAKRNPTGTMALAACFRWMESPSSARSSACASVASMRRPPATSRSVCRSTTVAPPAGSPDACTRLPTVGGTNRP